VAGGAPQQPGWQLAGLIPGAGLAGYRLEEQIGSGGMAVVFRARDESLGRQIALKVLPPSVAQDEEFRARFARESRAAAAVDHPHILPVYGAGEADGVLFIAMRLVAGGDLSSLLHREGPLAPERAARIVSSIAYAIDAAHAVGLVHRDVKPGNILVESVPGLPEHAYLSDFGLSKGLMSTTGLTGTGQSMGTPAYMAPEQISASHVDGRADQYALACVAVVLLTGRPPYLRDQPMAALWAHMSEPPPSVAALRPGIPRPTDQVIARALAKYPGERYGSCGEFAEALRAALAAGPSRGSSVPQVTRDLRGNARRAPEGLLLSPGGTGGNGMAGGYRRRGRYRAVLAGLIAAGVVAALGAGLGYLASDRSPATVLQPAGNASGHSQRASASSPSPGHDVSASVATSGNSTLGTVPDSVTGLSYSLLPSPWTTGCPSALTGQTFTWTAGESALAWSSTASGRLVTWYGVACSGPLPQRYAYRGTAGLESTALSLVTSFDDAYYRSLTHNRTQLLSAPVSVRGRPGWEVKYLMTYQDATSLSLPFSTEAAVVVLVDGGPGGPPTVFWASVPANLGLSQLDTLIQSLR
jgi:serine/threonine-protein kinase